jgi:hypothetical protein
VNNGSVSKEKKRKEEVRIVAIPNDNLDSLCFLGPTLPLRPSLTSQSDRKVFGAAAMNWSGLATVKKDK